MNEKYERAVRLLALGKKIKILVIDDDTSILRGFSRIFKRVEYDCSTVETGQEAIEKVKSQQVQVALLDVKLPDINGVDLVPILKKLAPKMIILIFTGYPTMEDGITAMDRGADAYLGKSIKPQMLLEIINEKMRAC